MSWFPSSISRFSTRFHSSMSTELKSTRKKRNESDASPSASVPEGDHRKRRRNRTTQSCLNCHTSKRMCDRKRPCGRCTQLGLTGLCVYEVDDPSQRRDGQDESSQLRKRVAELEGVIRELKNKPHPRWMQAGSTPSEEFEKWHVRSQSRHKSEGPQSMVPEKSDLPSVAKANSNEESSIMEPTIGPSLSQQDYFFSFLRSSLDTPALTFGLPSPLSSPPSVIMTPTDDHSRPYPAINGDQQLSGDLDLASLFISYPGMMDCGDSRLHVDRVLRGDSLNDSSHDSCSSKQNNDGFADGHCGCLNEATSYTVVLELSLRLRKAVDVLSRSSNHRLNNGVCALSQRITELDHLAKITLMNMPTTPNESLHSCSTNTTTHSTVAPFPVNGCLPTPISSSTVSQSLHGLRPWDIISSVSDISCDDSFMSWEPPRRG